MPNEEAGGQGSFAALEETAHQEREEAAEQQEDDDENVRERRGEVGPQFAFRNGLYVSPGVHENERIGVMAWWRRAAIRLVRLI